MSMNKFQLTIAQMLNSVQPTDGRALSEALQALGHGIAVLSTSSGDRALQGQFLERTFEAIRADGEAVMKNFDTFRGRDPEITPEAKESAAAVLQMFNKAGGKNNG